MNELALFAGAGGGLLASKLLGWSTVCAVEIEPYARKVLFQRQAEGHLERFPIWDDVRTFDGNPWRGSVDIVSGGFPCQNISSAGKREGITGKSSSLIYEMLRIVEEARPRFVFAENSPQLRANGLGAIISTLAGMGYDCAWGVLGAWHSGAPHKRNRLWLLAHANSAQREGNSGTIGIQAEHANACGAGWWQTEPALDRVANGFPDRVDQLKAIGNAQVPQVAALAFQVLSETLGV
tara:strand:- start:892 stop:1602 length:711 start_codon:yes stop_codon:yes gene_type:complete